jgi:hypothetical protein
MKPIQLDTWRRVHRAKRLFFQCSISRNRTSRSIDAQYTTLLRRERLAELAQVEIAWAFRLLLETEEETRHWKRDGDIWVYHELPRTIR